MAMKALNVLPLFFLVASVSAIPGEHPLQNAFHAGINAGINAAKSVAAVPYNTFNSLRNLGGDHNNEVAHLHKNEDDDDHSGFHHKTEQEPDSEELPSESRSKSLKGFILLTILSMANLQSVSLGTKYIFDSFGNGNQTDGHSQSVNPVNNFHCQFQPVYGQYACDLKIPPPSPEYLKKFGIPSNLTLLANFDGHPNQLKPIADIDLSSCPAENATHIQHRSENNLRASRKHLGSKHEKHNEEIVCKKEIKINVEQLETLQNKGKTKPISVEKLKKLQNNGTNKTISLDEMSQNRVKKNYNNNNEKMGRDWGKWFRHLLQAPKMTKLTVQNFCNYKAWPNLISGDPRFRGTPPESWKFVNIPPNQQQTIEVPFDTIALNMQFQLDCQDGGTGCTSASCNGNVCPLGQQGPGPKTQAEWTLHGDGGKDYYDVSLVNGQNLPIRIEAVGGIDCGTIPGCSLIAIADQLPAEIVVKDPKGNPYLVKAMCDVNQDPEYCCTGAYNVPGTCRPVWENAGGKAKPLYDIEHAACQHQYLYAYDDVAATFTCDMKDQAEPEYLIQLCKI